MRNQNNTGCFCIFIITVIILSAAIKSCSEPSASEKWYLEHKEAIDTYNENHKDDWNGYKGTRRNSWAEDQTLQQDGFDPEEYRRDYEKKSVNKILL